MFGSPIRGRAGRIAAFALATLALLAVPATLGRVARATAPMRPARPLIADPNIVVLSGRGQRPASSLIAAISQRSGVFTTASS